MVYNNFPGAPLSQIPELRCGQDTVGFLWLHQKTVADVCVSISKSILNQFAAKRDGVVRPAPFVVAHGIQSALDARGVSAGGDPGGVHDAGS